VTNKKDVRKFPVINGGRGGALKKTGRGGSLADPESVRKGHRTVELGPWPTYRALCLLNKKLEDSGDEEEHFMNKGACGKVSS